jgi:hypothetical protein
MLQIISDPTEETFKIYESWSLTATMSAELPPVFGRIGDQYIVGVTDLNNILSFKTFNFDYTMKTDNRFLKTYYRLSRDTENWTEWYDLPSTIKEFPPFNDGDTLSLDIKFVREGNSEYGLIKLLSWSIDGLKQRNQTDGESKIILTEENNQVIIKPPFIFKVFKIEDIEILSSDKSLTDVSIKYRYSQDYGRTVTNWEYFTKENITTTKINPIRFFQIEYLLEYTGKGQTKIFDINLIGDFQNVTEDYKKSNVYGIRENCNCERLGIVGDTTSSTTTPTGGQPNLLTQTEPTNVLPILSNDQINSLYKPYQLPKATELLTKMVNDANQMFGHEVVYFITDPDKKGIDHTFHEYQLFNYVCERLIKVSVENNQFPDNQIVMNQFDLSLFEAFEVHVPKLFFKEQFGPEKRPSKEDFLWFCELNRMFIVEHAQQFRSFNNNAVYYKLHLKKYVQKSNVIGVNQTITEKVQELTKNSTINELFGQENTLDKKSVSNKEEFRPLTRDITRVSIVANIVKQLVENAELVISKSHYDLSTVTFSVTQSYPAVTYRNIKDYFAPSDNLCYTCWFNLNNYINDDKYNFFNYYDNLNNVGLNFQLKSDEIQIKINQNSYSFELMGVTGGSEGLYEDTWYAYLVNIDQRKRELSQYIYKRDIEDEDLGSKVNSTKLKLIKTKTQTLSNFEFSIDNIHASILSSDMRITNIRLLSEVIPINQHSIFLNQYHLRDDTKYLIFGDNANQRLSLPYMPLNQVGSNDVG